MNNNLISFKKTVVGWYNYTVEGVMRYNIDPITFRRITGVSERATLGTCEVTAEELPALKEASKFIGLADGWEVVADDSQVSSVS